MSIDPCEVRPCKDKRGVDLISDALPFGRLCYGGPNAASNAVSYAMHYSRSHNKVIRVYDESGNVIDARAHGRFQRAVVHVCVAETIPLPKCRTIRHDSRLGAFQRLSAPLGDRAGALVGGYARINQVPRS